MLVKDQAGKERMSQSNGLGQLTDVWEITAADDATETVTFPGLGEVTAGYRTKYEYDLLGNLSGVTQRKGTSSTVQTRTFNYDSLSRLRSAINPESGTVSYSYDDNGNLSSKTDARSITTNYIYDALNRVTSRSYQNDPNNTPLVTYTYDSSSNCTLNCKGRLAKVDSNVSTYSYNGYDAMGRVQGASETLSNQSGSQTYTMTYGYDLAGHVTSIHYPSSTPSSTRLVNYVYDSMGRTNSVSGNLGGTSRNYSTGISYSPFGGLAQEQFGTQTALYQKLHYNMRGQLYDVRVSTASLQANEWNWNRGAIVLYYSSIYGYSGGGSGPDNNGNVLRAQTWVPLDENINNWVNSDDWYAYDSLNRLTSITEYPNNGSTATFKQQYDYDRWGNRTINAASWGVNSMQTSVDPNTNRLYAPNDPSHSWIDYDAAGNQTKDYLIWNGTRTYDAENRMITANNGASDVYTYDGDGRRVKRNISGTETWQVYGIGGELLAEYAANTPASTPQKEYGYRNGQLLITVTVTAGSGGSPFSFTDDPVVAGTTPVKATHLTELRTAVNQARAHAGLSAATWTDDPVQVAVTTIKAVHITELRTRLDQARAALGLSAASYTDPTLTAGTTTVKAVHIQELRTKTNEALTAGSGNGVDLRWLVNDQLGTPRMIFDQSGSLASVSRHDYLPFGEELFAGTGGRTTAQGYSASDGLRQHFSQKERDIETGLDYFLARYYSSTQGRFTSPDEFTGGPEEVGILGSGHPEKQALKYAEITNPQSLNKYQYAFNNPLRYVDPDGQSPQDGLEAQIRADEKAFAEGRISKEEFLARARARGVGGAIGALAVAAVIGGQEIGAAILMWAAANPDKVEQIASVLQETAGGPPGMISGVGTASKAEWSIAQKLAAEGKNVEIVAAQGAARTADFVVNGIKTELKTLEGVGGAATSGTVKNAIGRALGQSGNVIIDARNVKLTAEAAQHGAARAFRADKRLQVVRIIGKDYDFTAARH